MRRELTVDGLVYRDRSHDAPQGAFVLGSFWLVEALAAVGKTAEAVELFEATLTHANHLGLYPEQIDPATGEFRGNFPHALAHLGVIGSALALDSSVDTPA